MLKVGDITPAIAKSQIDDVDEEDFEIAKGVQVAGSVFNIQNGVSKTWIKYQMFVLIYCFGIAIWGIIYSALFYTAFDYFMCLAHLCIIINFLYFSFSVYISIITYESYSQTNQIPTMKQINMSKHFVMLRILNAIQIPITFQVSIRYWVNEYKKGESHGTYALEIQSHLVIPLLCLMEYLFNTLEMRYFDILYSLLFIIVYFGVVLSYVTVGGKSLKGEVYIFEDLEGSTKSYDIQSLIIAFMLVLYFLINFVLVWIKKKIIRFYIKKNYIKHIKWFELKEEYIEETIPEETPIYDEELGVNL